jgi:hypothetical protein
MRLIVVAYKPSFDMTWRQRYVPPRFFVDRAWPWRRFIRRYAKLHGRTPTEAKRCALLLGYVQAAGVSAAG